MVAKRPKGQVVRYSALDSWRGICALFVVMYHFPLHGNLRDLDFFRGGFLFVDFFFVLSGFVVTEAYGSRLTNLNELRNFIVRRFARVWPLHFAILMIYLAIELTRFLVIHFSSYTTKTSNVFEGSRSIASFLGNLFMVHSMGLFDTLTWNSPSWSISGEFWVYICFAFLLLWSKSHFFTLSALMASLAFLLLTQVPIDSIDTTYQYGFVRCIFGFFAGVLVWKVRSRWQHKQLPKPWIMEALTMLGIYVFVSFHHYGPLSFLSPLVFACAVFIFSFEQGPIAQFLQRGLFPKLATWSYSIYLIHELVLILMNSMISVGSKILATRSPDLLHSMSQFFANRVAMDGVNLLALAIVVGLASQSYRWIERPFQQRLIRLWSSR